MSTKGAWRLQEVRDKILAGEWIDYDNSNDAGQLWSWGFNGQGQLGIGTSCYVFSPVQIPGTQWFNAAGSGGHVIANKSDGTLWSWGTNGYNLGGRLGLNTLIPRHVCVPNQIPGTTWSSVIAAGGIASFAIKTDNTLWAWGSNCQGQLGENNTIQRCSPIQVPGAEWNNITASQHTLATKLDGTFWAWGVGANGRLGLNDLNNRSSPSQVPGTQWNDVSAAREHSLARKTDGTLWAWGIGSYGRLGNNNTIQRSSPVQIPGTQWNDISAHTYNNIARKTDGTLWAWGRTILGDNTIIDRSSPIQIPGTEWNDITFSGSYSGGHFLARKTDSTLWTWGGNSNGQLGDGTQITRSSPIQVPGTKWTFVSQGSSFSFARKAI